MLFQRRQAQFIGIIFGLVALVLVAYANAFTAPFIWDDEVMVQGNQLIQSWKNWAQIFVSSAFGGSMSSGKYYRPIQIFSYAIDVQLFGLKATAFHAMNIFYHILTTLFLFFNIRALKFSNFAAALCAALYAVHPINIESVTYISGRGDGLALLFTMIALYALIKAIQGSKSGGVIAIIAYIIAILAKENVLAFPFIAILTGILFYKKLGGKLTWRIDRFPLWQWTSLGLLTTMISYIWFRLSGTMVGGASLSKITAATQYERILTIPMIVWTYLKLSFWPYPLHMEYHFVIKTIQHPSWIVGIPATILMIGLLYIIFKKWPPFRSPLILGIGIFFLGLAPVYQIPFPLAATLREHWASLSFVGLYLIFAFSLDTLRKKISPKWVYLISVIILIALTTTTIIRNKDWRDPFRLYAHDLTYEPDSFLLHNNLGLMYFRMNDFPAAKSHFMNAIKVSPYQSYDVAYNNLGVIIEGEGDYLQAGACYLRSIEYGKYHLAYINLTRLLIKLNDLERAKLVAETGLKEYPELTELLQFKQALLAHENQDRNY